MRNDRFTERAEAAIEKAITLRDQIKGIEKAE